MRPLRLEIRGFTAFSTPQKVDFEALELFAIAGPTGSGKSSILDAMIWALYGKVPRLGARRGVRELISLSCTRASVVFDFGLAGQTWRVVRSASKRAASQAQLERITASGEIPEAGGVKAVSARIEELLGLGYDAFQRAVVLPQGGFDRFLRSPPAEKLQILRDLLRLGVYERMRKEAWAGAKRLSGDVEHYVERLAQDYEGVSPAALTRAEAEVSAKKTAAAAAATALEAATATAAEAEQLAERTRELSELEAAEAALKAAAAEMEAAQTRIASAERAASVVPALTRATDAASRVTEAETARAARATELSAAERVDQEAATALATAKVGLATVEGHPERIAQLTTAVELASARDDAKQRLAGATAAATAATEALTVAKAGVPAAEAALAAAGSAVKDAEAARAAVGYDAARDEALQAAPIEETAAARRQAEETAKAVTDAKAREAEAVDRLAQRRATAGQARANAETARAAATTAEAAIRACEHEHRVAAVRATVTAGAPCPVCDQMVSTPPAPLAGVTTLDETRTAAEQAAGAAATAEQTSTAASAALAAAQTQHAERQAATLRTEEVATVATGALRTLETSLETVAALLAPDDGPIEARARRAADVEARRRREDSAARATLEAARLAHTGAEGELTAARTALEAAEAAADVAAATATEARETLAELAAKVAGLTGGATDPAAERARLRTEYERAVEAEQVARKAATTAQSALASARRGADDAKAALQRRRAGQNEAEQGALKAAIVAGFDDAAAARAAALDPPELAALRERTRAHREQLTATTGRIAALQAELGDRRVTLEQLATAKAALQETQTSRETAVAAVAKAESERDRLSEQLERAAGLQTRLANARSEHRVYETLSRDLGSNQFQAWLTRETFHALVERASERLKTLTGRYTLDVNDDDIVVVDHDNAGQRRSSDTLSGGETFLTSLSLALELSEQIQQAAGAIRLDSLFIDEGFGTLDPETLDTVTEAIETLGGTGRMVGIITHITELTERLPARLQVEKTNDGSTVAVVR